MSWIKFAELETQLEDFPRVRGIYELGVSQSALSMPELLWKAYIDFETEEGEREKARALYERLIELSGHVKVWISYATFEAEPIPIPRAMREEAEDEDEEVPMVEGDPVRARQVFERAYKDLKSKGAKHEVRSSIVLCVVRRDLIHVYEQRVVLLEIWKTFEEKYGTTDDVVKVQGMMPITSKRRIVDKETGQTVEGALPLSPVCAMRLISIWGQTGTLCSRTTSANPIRRRSSSSRWHMRGRLREQRGMVEPVLLCRALWLLGVLRLPPRLRRAERKVAVEKRRTRTMTATATLLARTEVTTSCAFVYFMDVLYCYCNVCMC